MRGGTEGWCWSGISWLALVVPTVKPKTFTLGKLAVLFKTRRTVSIFQRSVIGRAQFYSSSHVGKHHSRLFVLERDNKSLSRAAKANLGKKKKRKSGNRLCFLREINKVSLYFYESCPGLLHRQLVFGIGSNEMFAHLLTFLSRNSKSPNLNALINFPPVFPETF